MAGKVKKRTREIAVQVRNPQRPVLDGEHLAGQHILDAGTRRKKPDIERRVAPRIGERQRSCGEAEQGEQTAGDDDDSVMLVHAPKRNDVLGTSAGDRYALVVAGCEQLGMLSSQGQRAGDDPQLGASIVRR